MLAILKNGWYAPNGVHYKRQEPWATAQSVPDNMFDALPTSAYVTRTPPGKRFDPDTKPDAHGRYKKTQVIDDDRLANPEGVEDENPVADKVVEVQTVDIPLGETKPELDEIAEAKRAAAEKQNKNKNKRT